MTPSAGEMIVLTPNGDPFALPMGATPIDFAYAVHLGLGHQCTGAQVNGRSASLTRPLRDGDTVKILTSRVSVGPSPDWLSVVKTRRARSAIRRWIKSQQPEEAAQKGWQLLDGQLRREGMLLSSPPVSRRLESVAREMGYEQLNDLFVAVGLHQRTPEAILTRMQQSLPEDVDASLALRATIVSLAESELPQQLAGCCRPMPPDRIVGYVTRRQVVSIHRADCGRVRHLRPLVNAEWNRVDSHRRVEIEVLALDRPGLVRDVSTVIAEAAISMTNFHADQMPDGSARIQIGLHHIASSQQAKLLAQLRAVPSVRWAAWRLPEQPSQFGDDSVLERHFVNPHTLRPVSGEGFFGRRAELRDLINHLRGIRPGEAVLLWGARRVGKTSLLMQFQRRVLQGDDYLPVFVDMQRLSGRSTTMFLRDILKSIANVVGDKRLKAPAITRMKRDPLGYFRSFLENDPQLASKHLVLILDEFQLLAELDEDDVTIADINRYFRSLIQHRSGLSMIFSGGGVLDTLLQQPDASFMLEVARYQKIDCLDEAAARQLIVESVQGVTYEEAVVEALLSLTAAHPYYLQWICGELLTRADRGQWLVIEISHLQAVLTDWLPQQGEQFFSHLWGSSSGVSRPQQQLYKLILVTMSHMQPRLIAGSEIEVAIGNALPDAPVWQALQELAKMDTLLGREGQYAIKVDVLAQWLRANYTVAQLLKEASRFQGSST